jgi:hypothetical protein
MPRAAKVSLDSAVMRPSTTRRAGKSSADTGWKTDFTERPQHDVVSVSVMPSASSVKAKWAELPLSPRAAALRASAGMRKRPGFDGGRNAGFQPLVEIGDCQGEPGVVDGREHVGESRQGETLEEEPGKELAGGGDAVDGDGEVHGMSGWGMRGRRS